MSADPVNVVVFRLADSDIERIAECVMARVAAAAPPAHPAEREWFTTVQAADYVGLAAITLEILRHRGGGPKYHKPSRNIVRYRRVDLDAYIAKNGRHNTSEDAPGVQRAKSKRAPRGA